MSYFASLREQQLRESAFFIVTVADVPVTAAAMCIPTAIGLFIGAAIARSRAAPFGPNALLEAAGGYAIVGALAAVALGPALPMLVMTPSALSMAPYTTVGLDALPHAFVLVCQVSLSAAIYVLRRGAFDARSVAIFARMGLAGVAYADLIEIWFTLTLDHNTGSLPYG